MLGATAFDYISVVVRSTWIDFETKLGGRRAAFDRGLVRGKDPAAGLIQIENLVAIEVGEYAVVEVVESPYVGFSNCSAFW